MRLATISKQISDCRICRDNPVGAALPHEPNPVCVASSTARICIAGQAPGKRVHESGKPFTDPSGERLRDWMGISEATFYDPSRLAIVPMGFCFPGYDKNGGDLPPRKECRANWHDQLYDLMPQIELFLTIGQYAQAYHLGNRRKKNMTETVRAWKEYLVDEPRSILPLPHPSWRNNAWLKRNPWFGDEVLPKLRGLVQDLV